MTRSLMERREYTRLVVDIEAVLGQPDGTCYPGRVRDISFAGAYLDCDDASQGDEAAPMRGCVLSLLVDGRPAPIRLRCIVVDRQGGRVGLRFTGAEESDFTVLREYLLSQSDDPDALTREIRDMPNPVFAPPLPRFANWLSQLVLRG